MTALRFMYITRGWKKTDKIKDNHLATHLSERVRFFVLVCFKG